MTSISRLIGLQGDVPPTQTAISSLPSPSDYDKIATQAQQLDKHVRTAYQDHLHQKQSKELQQDRHFLNRAREFVSLSDQVTQSTQLLTDLSQFLTTFQGDLQQVSGHISELQDRSKTIEARLESRKTIESLLQPYLESITISPRLITLILDTEVSPEWIPAVVELDQKLGAVRGGARVEGRKKLDEAAEGLRVVASTKIVQFLTNLLRPYTTSLTSLSPLHTSYLLYKPLFDFLRRHSARQAHEVQKSYVQTTRWYYETGVRRYVRVLEGLRTGKIGGSGGGEKKWEGIVSTGNASEASLALLNAKKLGTPRIPSSSSSSASSRFSRPTRSAIANSRLDEDVEDEENGGEKEDEDDELSKVIPAYGTIDKTFRPSPEQIFRSISLVISSSCSTEYEFIDSFFGTHSNLSPSTTSNVLPGGGPMRRLSSNGSLSNLSTTSESHPHTNSHHTTLSTLPEGQSASPAASTPRVAPPPPQSESGKTVTSNYGAGGGRDRELDEQKMRKVVVEGLWKNVMEPALEYSFDLIHALLTPPSNPSPLSLLSMIRLNSSLLSSSSTSSSSSQPCPPPFESHLYSIRFLLWPLFTKTLDREIDSVKKINGSNTTSSGGGGIFSSVMSSSSSSTTTVKDSTVHSIVERYLEWFNAFVEISKKPNEEDDSVFQPLLRLRQEIDRLLVHQASKIATPMKQNAFLRAGYQELVSGLSSSPSIQHERVQRELGHYRELLRSVE